MIGKARRLLRSLGPEVVASVLAHALFLAGLFLLPGLVGEPPEPSQTTVVRAEPAPEDLLEPPPPPPPEDLPDDPPPLDSPEILDPPVEDFPDEPEDAPPAIRDDPISDLPWARAPRRGPVIGVGGGAANRRPAPPPPVVEPPPPPEPAPAAGPTENAVVEKRKQPRYPRRAVDRGLEGCVILLIEVLPDGTVGEIRVEESSGHDLLDRAAIDAARTWEFRPALVNGEPVRSWVEQKFTFQFD